jgi:hypothetical protein
LNLSFLEQPVQVGLSKYPLLILFVEDKKITWDTFSVFQLFGMFEIHPAAPMFARATARNQLLIQTIKT